MRKNWKSKVARENAWGLKFTRWYFIAPSGNKYCMWRGCYFNRIFIPKTHKALAEDDKNNVPNTEFETIISNKTYQDALTFIYDIESKGGFPEQKKMNAYLDNNREMNYMFNVLNSSLSYNSMP